jgi:hypothetical protein
MSAYERKTEKFYAFVLLAALVVMVEIVCRYLFLKSVP